MTLLEHSGFLDGSDVGVINGADTLLLILAGDEATTAWSPAESPDMTFLGNWDTYGISRLGYAACAGALVIAFMDEPDPDALVVNLSEGWEVLGWMLEIEGVTQGAFTADLERGTGDLIGMICAFPDVCFTPPETELSAERPEFEEWFDPDAIIAILVGVVTESAPAVLVEPEAVPAISSDLDLWG